MPDIRFYLSLLLRRLHYVLILTALGLAAGATVATILPPTYVAAARMVVESEQIPGDLAESTVRVEAIEQLQIIEQRITSRDRLIDIAERFDVYGRRPGEGQPLRPDEIVDDMRDRIRIVTRGGAPRRGGQGAVQATLVDVAFEAEEPRLAAAVANEVVTLILQENQAMRTNVSGETLAFFEGEVERLDRALSERSGRIVSFQEENRDALPDSLEFRRNQLTSIQERLLQLEREEASLRDRRENLDTLFRATGGVGNADAALSPEAADLRALREQFRAQSAVLSEQNPRMRMLQSRIEVLETVVAEQEEAAALEAGATDEEGAALTAFDVQLADLDRQIELVGEQRGRLEAEAQDLLATIGATPSNAVTLGALERDYENLRVQYDQAVARRAAAETGDIIESLSKGERISVIEQAVAPREPTSPDRPKLVIAGTGAGLLAGLGLIALIEVLTTAVRRPSEIVNKLDIAPLATLSFIHTRRELMLRRAAIAGAFAVALLGVPAGLWAVDTYLMPLDLIAESVVERLPEPLRAVVETAGLGG